MALGTHAVKAKAPDAKVWAFVTPEGGLNRLRVHAGTASPETCQEYADKMSVKLADTAWQFKVVRL